MSNLFETKKGEHATGFAFFGAIRIVTVQVARRTDARVVNFFYAERAALPDNFRGEIDFVMRRANARAELHDQIRGLGTEAINHCSDRVWDDTELSAFASGMHKSYGRLLWIENVNSTTVSDVNAQRDTGLIGDDAVAARKVAAHGAAATTIDDADFVSVNLFGYEKRPTAHADCVANFAMGSIEPLQHFSFIVQNIYAGNSLREDVARSPNRAECRKLLERQIHYRSSKTQAPTSREATSFEFR
jgi:hypothetical protein